MTVLAWIELISLVLKFPSTVLQLVRVLSKSPEEKQQEIVLQVNAWAAESAASDRPKWEDK